MAVVNQMDMKTLHICKDFANVLTQQHLKFMVCGFPEVRLVFDRYIPQSLKNRTRDKKRTSGTQIRYKIDDNTVIVGLNSKKFLSHIETKKELTKYLAEASVECFKKIPIDHAVSFETQHTISNLQSFPEKLSGHDHEEADTLMLLHEVNVPLS